MEKWNDEDSEVDMSWVELMGGSEGSMSRSVDAKGKGKVEENEGKEKVDAVSKKEPLDVVVSEEEEIRDREKMEVVEIERPRPPPRWWKPEERPIAEPPIFDYEKFEDEKVPSDKKLKKMFGDGPGNVEKRTMHRDLETEVELLKKQHDWLLELQNEAMKSEMNHVILVYEPADEDGKESLAKPNGLMKYYEHTTVGAPNYARGRTPEITPERLEKIREKRGFYFDFISEIRTDLNQVTQERNHFRAGLNALTIWEHRNLDNDGNTTGLELATQSGRDVFTHSRAPPEARIKYAYLLHDCPGRLQHDLATWEALVLDEDGGTKKVQNLIRQNVNVFTNEFYGGLEAASKYQKLCVWEAENLQSDGVSLDPGIESAISLANKDIFGDVSEAKKKYSHFMDKYSRYPQHDIATWEHFWLAEIDGVRRVVWEAAHQNIKSPFSGKTYGGIVAARMYEGFYQEVEKWCNKNIRLTSDPSHDIQGPRLSWSSWDAKTRLERGRDELQEYNELRGSLEPLIRQNLILGHSLEIWEHHHLDADGRTSRIERRVPVFESRFQPHFYGAMEARREYGYLVPKEDRLGSRWKWLTRPFAIHIHDELDNGDVEMRDVGQEPSSSEAEATEEEELSSTMSLEVFWS